MAYRCEGCGKLCGVEQADPEVQEESVDDDGNVSVTVHIQLQSTCCGDDLEGAETDLEFEDSIEIAHVESEDDPCKECDLTRKDHPISGDSKHDFDWDQSEHTLSLTVEAEADDWNEGTGGYRFQKHYWGADISGTVECDHCGATGDINCERQGEPASSFDQFSGGSFSRNARAKKRRQEAQSAIVADSTPKSTMVLSDEQVADLKDIKIKGLEG